jgi:DNA-binding NarL/FixJ family response regulator
MSGPAGREPAPEERSSTVRVLLVDDHRVITETLAAVIDLEDDLECVGGTGTVSEMLDLVAERRPDVVVMDVRLPGATGSRAPGDCGQPERPSGW